MTVVRSPIMSPIRSPIYNPTVGAWDQGIPTQAEATTFFARQATQMPADYKTAYNRFVYDLKQASIWSTLSRLYVLAGYTQADSYLNLVNTSGTLSALSGTISFEAGRGMTGDGVGSLNANDLLAGGLTPLAQDDACISFYTTKAGNMAAATVGTSSTNNTLLSREANRISGRLISANSNNITYAAGVGLVTVRRTAAGLVKVDLDGVNLDSKTSASTTPSGAFRIMQAVTARSTDRVAIVAVGSYLSDAQSASFSEACDRLLEALGWTAPAYTSYTRSSASTIQLPGNSGASVANKGIVLTGLCKDTDGTWWGCDYGLPAAGDPTGWATRIVQMSSDFSSILTSIYATDLGLAATVGFQGLAIDTSDDTLFVTSPTAGRIYHVSKAGSLLATLTKSANGLAYNSLADTLITTTTSNMLSINKATAADVGLNYRLPFEVDQIYFDAANNRVFTSGGSNGSPCQMSILDLAGPYGNYPAESKRITMTNVLAAEGLSIVGSTAYVSSDEAFHIGGSSVNSVQTIDLTGIV